MSDTTHSDPNPPDTGYERRDVSSVRVILYGVLGIVAVVIVVVFIVDYFTAVKNEIISEMVLKPESATLRELRAREAGELTGYGVIDEPQGVYRIPIERAMELMADEAYQGQNPQSR